MSKKSEIKKNIKFYKKEMEKWELRILLSLISIFLGITIFCFLNLKANDWNITSLQINTLELPKFGILTPFIFCLSFSSRQFNYYKKQLDLYKLKKVETEEKRVTTTCIINCFGRCLFGKFLRNFLAFVFVY